MQFLNHPSIRVRLRDWVWRFKSLYTGRFESMAGVITRMSEHEHQIEAGVFQLMQSAFYELAADALFLKIRDDSQRCQNG